MLVGMVSTTDDYLLTLFGKSMPGCELFVAFIHSATQGKSVFINDSCLWEGPYVRTICRRHYQWRGTVHAIAKITLTFIIGHIEDELLNFANFNFIRFFSRQDEAGEMKQKSKILMSRANVFLNYQRKCFSQISSSLWNLLWSFAL